MTMMILEAKSLSHEGEEEATCPHTGSASYPTGAPPNRSSQNEASDLVNTCRRPVGGHPRDCGPTRRRQTLRRLMGRRTEHRPTH